MPAGLAAKALAMKLHFPNPSRSFDESHHRVLFWGYDDAIEVSFFVEAEALKLLYPKMDNNEAGFLKAFDATRDKIYGVANKCYLRGGRGKGTYAYVLAAEHF